MKILRFLLGVQLLTVVYLLYKLSVSSVEKSIILQLPVYYLLLIWAMFGLIYVTVILDKDMDRILGKGEKIGDETKK